jgi:hypothetical protein
LPITINLGQRSVPVTGLVDSGATVSVLPYDIGLQLGAIWERQTTAVTLDGNLAAFEARGIVVSATVGAFPPVRLVFSWTRAEGLPVILGQMNFFLEFDLCFFRSRSVFEVRPKGSGTT